MALTFLRLFGKGREELSMAVTGFLVSIPIFCDSGFVILTPLAKAISLESRKSIVSIGISLAAGLVITHTMVPPTPGPVGVAGIFGVSVGALVLWGLLLSVPMLMGCLLFARWAGKKIWQIPTVDGNWTRDITYRLQRQNSINDTKNLPSVAMSFAPILVPILLILMATTMAAIGMQGAINDFMQFLGAPVIAVGIGLLLTIYGLGRHLTRKESLDEMETGIRSAGIIILITGAGGAFGMLIRDSGVGTVIAEALAATNLPAILLPFLIATIVRFIQGSGTVAMITAASITAPILMHLPVNPIFSALAACVGSLFCSYFNDSFFWVVNRSIGIVEGREQLRLYTVASTIAWAIGIVCLLILNAVVN